MIYGILVLLLGVAAFGLLLGTAFIDEGGVDRGDLMGELHREVQLIRDACARDHRVRLGWIGFAAALGVCVLLCLLAVTM
jgi:hypothetical protein